MKWTQTDPPEKTYTIEDVYHPEEWYEEDKKLYKSIVFYKASEALPSNIRQILYNTDYRLTYQQPSTKYYEQFGTIGLAKSIRSTENGLANNRFSKEYQKISGSLIEDWLVWWSTVADRHGIILEDWLLPGESEDIAFVPSSDGEHLTGRNFQEQRFWRRARLNVLKILKGSYEEPEDSDDTWKSTFIYPPSNDYDRNSVSGSSVLNMPYQLLEPPIYNSMPAPFSVGSILFSEGKSLENTPDEFNPNGVFTNNSVFNWSWTENHSNPFTTLRVAAIRLYTQDTQRSLKQAFGPDEFDIAFRAVNTVCSPEVGICNLYSGMPYKEFLKNKVSIQPLETQNILNISGSLIEEHVGEEGRTPCVYILPTTKGSGNGLTQSGDIICSRNYDTPLQTLEVFGQFTPKPTFENFRNTSMFRIFSDYALMSAEQTIRFGRGVAVSESFLWE